MFRGLVVVALLAAFTATSHGQGLTCAAGQTEVKTPYVYDSSNKYADCPALIGSFIDWYNPTYRASCQRWMGGNTPERIENAYVTECHRYDNGTLRYRAEVCCVGTVTAQRCFTCSEAPDHYSCNYHGTVDTCAAGAVCHTTFTYSGTGGNYCTRKISKGCLAKATCDARVAEDATRCKNYVANPQCAYCYTSTLGNFLTPSENAAKFCGPKTTTRCEGVYCGNGKCVEDTSMTAGYRCDCYGYGIKDAQSGVCSKTVCDLGYCKNGGACSFLTDAPYYSCCCPIGFYGQNCTEKYGACATNDCQNGGTCYDQGTNGQRCMCAAGYVGEKCETKDVKCTYPDNKYTNTYNALAMYDKTCSTYQPYAPSFLTACIWKMKQADRPAFQTGVHGEVNALEYLGLSSCARGDKCGWLTIKACCPSCYSNPCLNGGWCLQKSDHDFVCKCRFGYEGKFCENKVALCVTSGDPHIYTFDGQAIHYQGECKYKLSVPTRQYGDLTYFEVLTKNERRGSPHVSYPSYMEVKVFGKTVRLGKNNVVTVDGNTVDLDISYPGFSLTYNGRFVRLETNFSLVVEFDGDWIGIVKLPGEYKGKMGGICANYDDEPSNDLVTAEGTDVTGEPDAHNQIGNSWMVPDPGNPDCPVQDGPDPTCDEAAKTEAKKLEYCGYIISTTGPFQACVNSEKALVEQYMFNCEYDVCLGNNSKDSACRSLEALVAQCASKGYVPAADWRTTTKCPLTCPTGMTYMASASACHSTCENPLAAKECGLPDTESCKCPEGKLRLGDKCVTPAECGCKDALGVRHVLNSQWLSKDCTIRYTCSPCASCGTGVGEITTATNTCPSGYSCSVDDSGDPTCLPPPATTPKPDPPVDGGWTEWSYTPCTMKFNRGEKIGSRTCTNPAPAYGGAGCQGPSSQTIECEQDCQAFVAADDCQRCDLTRNPAGYLGDSCSCKFYWQCYRFLGMWRAHRRQCSACTCWDQDRLTCVRDPDATGTDCSDPYVEQLAVNGDSCIIDGKRFHRIPADPTKFRETVFNTLEVVHSCAPGTGFSVDECKCLVGDVVAVATKKVFCLSFDKDFTTDKGVWVDPVHVERVPGGKKGYAAQFRNAKQSYIEIPFFTNNEFSQFSFSLWYKRTGASITGNQGLVYNGDCKETGSIQITSQSIHKTNAGILTSSGSNVLNHPDLRDKTAALDAWHHVVLTYNGTKVNYYVDNVKVGTVAATGPTQRIHTPLVLGSCGHFFNGLMDEVCFYNEALTVEEVEMLYQLKDVN